MKSRCPACAEKGEDRSGDNLHNYPNGQAHCHKCGFHSFPDKEGTMPVAPKEDKVPRPELSTLMLLPQGHDVRGRKIHTDVIRKYDIRIGFNTATGDLEDIVYPYHDKLPNTKITSAKLRVLPKTFTGTKPMPKSFFGEITCDPKARPYLFLTEGEEDCLAVCHMLMYSTAGTPMPADVVSLPDGASLSDALRDRLDFFTAYKRVYLVFDCDKAGKKASVQFGDWLSTSVETRIVELDISIGEDPSDYRVNFKDKEFRAAVKAAKVYSPEGVVNGLDIDLDDLLTPIPMGITIPFHGLNEAIGGIRKAEIYTVCAGSGIGKSTLVREINKALIDQGLSTANIALEDQMNVAAQALIALDMDMPLKTFRFSPPSKSATQPHYDKMIANGRTFFFKHFGGLNAKSLIDKLYYYARSKAVDFIILDHLSMVISSTSSTNERKDIDTLMTELAKMVVETGVGLIQVVHLKRAGDSKSFAKGGEVELTDLRGSAALEQLSWTVIGMERDQQDDEDPENKNKSKVRVLKNRTWSTTGLCDTLIYNTKTGRMSSYAPTVPVVGDEDELDA